MKGGGQEQPLPGGRTLSIVIPALDEEDAIGDTVRACLDARAHLIEKSPVSRVEVIVVSDGSSDRTEEIALGFEEVTVLAFERNRGYGAAILCGFDHASGDWLGFLDADGTCDPRFFADLLRALEEDGVDVALGSRLGPESEMPWLRTLGNMLFAWMLGLLSKQHVRDTASGMRVLRRGALEALRPLPRGLHFTPAMSARVLLEDRLRLVEIPMPYAERVGRSKLHVATDGVRFMKAIVQAAMAYRPARPLLLVAGATAGLAALVGSYPVFFYATHLRLEEWMIYRILLASLLATLVVLLLCAAVVAERIAAAAHGREVARRGLTAFVSRAFTRRARRVLGSGLGVAALAIVAPGIVEYMGTGEVEMHWSRAVLSSLLLVMATAFGVSTFLLNMLELIETTRGEPATLPPPDRVRRAGEAP